MTGVMTMKPDFIDKIDQKNEIALVLSFILLELKCFAKKKCPQVVYAYSPYTAPLFFYNKLWATNQTYCII